MNKINLMTKLSVLLIAVSSAAAFAADPVTYAIDCSFATSAKKAPVTCTVKGSVCIGECTAGDIDLYCTDGFALKDPAATHTINGTILTVQGKDALNNMVSIDFNGFDNKAGVLESNLMLTSAGVQKAIVGSCTLK